MYIRGFLDGYSARQETICFPENLTVGEAIAAFVRLYWGGKDGADRAGSFGIRVHGYYVGRLSV